tara:strand:+ start:132 stop:725 length:594 start_codon:yes stop_codon:yes gene_type:complete
MDNQILVFDDIINVEHQEKIKNILLGDEILNDIGEFPWYLTKDVTNDNLPDSQKRPGFFHALVKYNENDDNRLGYVSSLFHELFLQLIENSCEKLNIREVDVYQGRSFLQLPLFSEKPNVDTPHTDLFEKHFVMLYYVMDSDGDTIIYNETEKSDKYTIKQKVTPKQGRVVLFDGSLYHTAEQPINNVRCIVNYDLI